MRLPAEIEKNYAQSVLMFYELGRGNHLTDQQAPILTRTRRDYGERNVLQKNDHKHVQALILYYRVVSLQLYSIDCHLNNITSYYSLWIFYSY